MSTDPLPLDEWVPQAIDMMLAERVSFEHAAMTLGHAFPNHDEAARYMRRKSYRDAWERQQKLYYESKSSPAAHTKTIAIGKMIDDSDRLRQAGRFKEAAEILFSVAKAEGWVGPETTTNIFQDLSGQEIERLRDALAKRREATAPKPN